MSDKLQGGVFAGATSVSLDAVMRQTADSTEQTGKVAADMTLSYWRQGGVRVAVSASDLAAVNSAWSSGGVKEVDSTNMPGAYRIDWPDVAFASGADWVHFTVKISSDFVYHERIPITSNVVQGGDNFARLGPPAGASHAADVAAVKSDTATILTDVNTGGGAIFNRLGPPAGASIAADIAAVETNAVGIKTQTDKLAFTVSNKVDANVLALNGDATAAANVAKTTRAIARGTVGSSASTTSVPTSAFTPAGGAADQFKGRIVTFDADTATVALRGQSTDITASTNSATPTLTVSALTTAPSSGDTFSVT